MSSFGSSVINKSQKKLAPKIPAYRRRPPNPTHAPNKVSQVQTARSSESSAKENHSGVDHGLSQPRSSNRTVPDPVIPIREPAADMFPAWESIHAEDHSTDRSRKRRRVDSLSSASHKSSAGTSRPQVSADGVGTDETNENQVESISKFSVTLDRATNSTRTISQVEDQTSRVAGKIDHPRQEASSSSAGSDNAAGTIALELDDTQLSYGGTLNEDIERELRPSGQETRKRVRPKPTPNLAQHPELEDVQTQWESVSPTSSNESLQAISSRKKRCGRKATPESAEDHEIDPETLTMYDLCRDNRKGKKSRLEAEMQEVDWTEVVRRRKDTEHRAREDTAIAAREVNYDEGRSNGAEEAGPQGPQLRLVNGQIVVDNSSLVVDRHAGARPDEAQPAVEEQDITRRVNNQSWINDNRKDPEERYRISNKSDPWSAEATEAFYGALRMFGTDFMVISKMFPGRTRRHIKLKFVREERSNPAKIKDALIGGNIPMNLHAYCEATGERTDDYKDPGVLEKELKADEERQKSEIEKQKEELAEAQRKKQESAAAKAAAGRQRKAGNKNAPKPRKKGYAQDAAPTHPQPDGAAGN